LRIASLIARRTEPVVKVNAPLRLIMSSPEKHTTAVTALRQLADCFLRIQNYNGAGG